MSNKEHAEIMRKASLVVVGMAAVAFALQGCGTKVPGVPSNVAVVNGESISATTYLDEVNRRIGQDVLRNMIEQKVIVQWAKEEDVPVTDEQVKKQIAVLEREGQYEDQAKFMGEAGLKSEITAMQARINLAKKFTTINDEDLQRVYDMMKSRYVHGPRKQVALIINSDKGKLDDAAKALKSGKEFEQAATEYTDSRMSARGPIKIWVDEEQAAMGFPPELLKNAKSTKINETSKVFTIGQTGQPTQHVLLKVLREQPKESKKWSEVKEELENTAAMQNAQMDPDFQKKLNEKLKDAKIEVKIKEFEQIVQGFKNPPEPSPMMMSPGAAPKPQAKPAPSKE